MECQTFDQAETAAVQMIRDSEQQQPVDLRKCSALLRTDDRFNGNVGAECNSKPIHMNIIFFGTHNTSGGSCYTTVAYFILLRFAHLSYYHFVSRDRWGGSNEFRVFSLWHIFLAKRFFLPMHIRIYVPCVDFWWLVSNTIFKY